MTDVVDATTTTVSNVGEMGKYISEYGAAAIILSVFLVIFLIFMIYLLYQNSKSLKNKDEQIKFLMNQTADKLELELQSIKDSIATVNNTANKQDYHSKKHGISDFINYNGIMKSACKEALSTLKCSRVAIYVFHNGNMSLHGFSFYKMSCIGEWSATPDGVTRGQTHSQMPLHLFEDVVESLLDNGEYFIHNISSIDMTNDSIYNFVCNTRIKSLYIKSIVDEEGNPAGFSICEFNDETTKDEDEIRKVLQAVNDKVSPILLSTNIDKIVGKPN